MAIGGFFSAQISGHKGSRAESCGNFWSDLAYLACGTHIGAALGTEFMDVGGELCRRGNIPKQKETDSQVQKSYGFQSQNAQKVPRVRSATKLSLTLLSG